MTRIVFKDYKNIKQVIDFLYEDENMIVVNKPAHLPVIPDRFEVYNYNLRDMLRNHLLKENPAADIYVVHRIDIDTTGLVLLAKNEIFHKLLNDLFENRQIEKTYLALVTGHMQEKNGIINKPILKATRKMIIADKGKPSITEYKVLEEFENYSLLRLKPLSGRTHQIRVHLKSMGCPLIIDSVYGKNDAFFLHQIKNNYRHKEQQAPKALSSRLTLHALRLHFADPKSKRHYDFEAPVAKDFMAVLKSLRKYNTGHSQQSIYKKNRPINNFN